MLLDQANGVLFSAIAAPFNHSFIYFGKDQGVGVYTFRDERDLLWHSLVFSAVPLERRVERSRYRGEKHPIGLI